MDLHISVAGDERAAERLQKMGSRASRARPVLLTVARQMVEAQEERFSRGRFKKLAASTVARKRRQGLDPRPLRASGALMKSLTQTGGKDQILRAKDDELVFGTKVYYARFHQKGEGVPVRKPLHLTPRQRQPISRTILDYLTGGR